jgi:hypothetical protein
MTGTISRGACHCIPASTLSKRLMTIHSKSDHSPILSGIDQIRRVVAFLGSSKCSGWWDCSFMDETGLKYLSVPFPRSAAQAALRATIEAAQRVHDAALGKIGCYHLFRLPIPIEERLADLKPIGVGNFTVESARNELAEISDASINAPEGPVQIGVERKILTATSLQEMAAHYLSAFEKGIRCYPYFSVGA